MQLTKEQQAAKFATFTLESLTVMAVSLRSLLETGKDLKGNVHPLSVAELRSGFTEEQTKAVESFIGLFAVDSPAEALIVPATSMPK